jgi:hypothetical protein
LKNRAREGHERAKAECQDLSESDAKLVEEVIDLKV